VSALDCEVRKAKIFRRRFTQMSADQKKNFTGEKSRKDQVIARDRVIW
jgi:hypothetical protein